MVDNLYSQIHTKFIRTGILLALVLTVGTTGYWFIGGKHYSLVDCFYMTVITITTIGYSEIIDMSGNPGARIFTIFVAVSGISVGTYILTNVTAFMVEGELNKAFRRKRMEKMIKKLRGHYIVCGIDGVGSYVITELVETKRPFVIVDISKAEIEKVLETSPDEIFLEGDATDSDVLSRAGIEHAKGLFAVTGDDNQNLVVSLTAKQLNAEARVVASCKDLKNVDKIRKAGADAVVSPTFIGGLRMASEMVRSTVVSFLDTMLRDKKKNLRIEEISVPVNFAERPIADLHLGKHPDILLLAVKRGTEWLYNPQENNTLQAEDTLIFMTTPEQRLELEKIFEG